MMHVLYGMIFVYWLIGIFIVGRELTKELKEAITAIMAVFGISLAWLPMMIVNWLQEGRNAKS